MIGGNDAKWLLAPRNLTTIKQIFAIQTKRELFTAHENFAENEPFSGSLLR